MFNFNNMSVASKIRTGFGIVIGLLIIIAAVGSFSLSNACSGFTIYRDVARSTNLMGRIQANLLEARMEVKNYLITGTDEAKNKFEERWGSGGEFRFYRCRRTKSGRTKKQTVDHAG